VHIPTACGILWVWFHQGMSYAVAPILGLIFVLELVFILWDKWRMYRQKIVTEIYWGDRCEECFKVIDVCTCAVEIDPLQIPV
jgi:hypothetical protein